MDVSIIVTFFAAIIVGGLLEWLLHKTVLPEEPTTRWIIAVVVAIIFFAGVALWPSISHTPQAYIDSHDDEDYVLRTIPINGRYENFSEDDALWVYVHPSVSDLYYLSKADIFNNGTWEISDLVVGNASEEAAKQSYELGLLLGNKRVETSVDGVVELPEGVRRLNTKIIVYREILGGTVTPEPTKATQLTNSPVPMPTSTPVPLPTVTSAPTRVPTNVPTSTTAPSPTHTATPKPPTITPTPALGIGSTRVRPTDGAVMVYVPAGEFMMGSDKYGDEYGEMPIHPVYLNNYWIDQMEVTNRMYAQCVADGDCRLPERDESATRSNYYGSVEFDNYPVIEVSWNDAVTYCEWADARLPTEAEWEKAASWDEEKQEARTYPWGETIDCRYANYHPNNYCVGDTAAVASYPNGVSPYGALDMAGNVWEWTSTLYQSYPYVADDGRERMSSIGTDSRVLRGGSWWNSYGYVVRAAIRNFSHPAGHYDFIGFRCAQ